MQQIPCPLCDSTDHRVVARFAGPFNCRLRNVICRECGFLFRNPQWDQTESLAFRDQASRHGADMYESAHLTAARQTYETRRAARRLRWLGAHIRPPARVLEVGAGGGAFIEAAREVGFDAVGIEVDEQAVATARERSVPVRLSPLEDVNWPEGFFDVIVMFFALEHVADLNATFAKVRQLLCADGCLIIEVPDTMRIGVRPKDYFLPEHNWHFTPRSLELLLAKRGLMPARLLRRDTGDGHVLFAVSHKGRVPGPDEICIKNPLEYERVLACLKEAQRRVPLKRGILVRDALSLCLGPRLGMHTFRALYALKQGPAEHDQPASEEALASEGVARHDHAVA